MTTSTHHDVPDFQQFTIVQTADLLGYSTRTVHKLIADGHLRAIKRGRMDKRVTAGAIRAFQVANTVPLPSRKSA